MAENDRLHLAGMEEGVTDSRGQPVLGFLAPARLGDVGYELTVERDLWGDGGWFWTAYAVGDFGWSGRPPHEGSRGGFPTATEALDGLNAHIAATQVEAASRPMPRDARCRP